MVDDLIDYYIGMKRVFYKNDFIRKPKEDSKEYQNLLKLYNVLTDNGFIYGDYLLFIVTVYRKRNIFPGAYSLFSEKAIGWYKRFLANRIEKPSFLLTSDFVYIKSTGMYYKTSEFIRDFNRDSRYLSVVATNKSRGMESLSKEELGVLRRQLEYVVAKYEYMKRGVPEFLLSYKEMINGGKNDTN